MAHGSLLDATWVPIRDLGSLSITTYHQPTMANNRYVFNTTLEGFVNVYEDSGKFNNRCFSLQGP